MIRKYNPGLKSHSIKFTAPPILVQNRRARTDLFFATLQKMPAGHSGWSKSRSAKLYFALRSDHDLVAHPSRSKSISNSGDLYRAEKQFTCVSSSFCGNIHQLV
jgi:hypothetical protein